MNEMQNIFSLSYDFLKNTDLNIFGFEISLLGIIMIAVSFEVAGWLLMMWKGENNGAN